MPNPTLVTTFVPLFNAPELVEYGVDGVPKKVLMSGAVSEPAWSSRGELAVVGQRGWIWVGLPGHLRRLSRGSAPSWSPNGRQIVFLRGGWLMVGSTRDRSFRRLVRGTAPAWSPNGKWIAFIGKRHRLSVVPVKGGHVRRIGAVTGTTVDWQPLLASPPAACQTPPGSTVLASSDTATLSADTASSGGPYGGITQAAMGCLHADGRERVLDFEPEPLTGLSPRQGAVAGPYAALLSDGGARYGITFISVKLYDLRTAEELANREITAYCICEGQTRGDQLVLGSDGVMAVHTTAGSVEQIQASDSTGVHTLDSVTQPAGSPPALTNLTLTGDTLTWQHNGTPRSAQLQP